VLGSHRTGQSVACRGAGREVRSNPTRESLISMRPGASLP
jgi:hypothetical protein